MQSEDQNQDQTNGASMDSTEEHPRENVPVGIAEEQDGISIVGTTSRENYSKALAEDGFRFVEFLVSVSSEDAPATEVDSVDIVLVVDTSGSMSEGVGAGSQISRMELVKIATAFALDNLPHSARVGIVSFNEEATLCHDLATVGERRDSLRAAVNLMKAGGSTNMCAGLQMGANLLSARNTDSANNDSGESEGRSNGLSQCEATPERPQVLVLLSDGFVNAGRRDVVNAIADDGRFSTFETWVMPITTGADISLCQRVTTATGGILAAVEDENGVAGAVGVLLGTRRALTGTRIQLTPPPGGDIELINRFACDKGDEPGSILANVGTVAKGKAKQFSVRAKVPVPDTQVGTSPCSKLRLQGQRPDGKTVDLHTEFSMVWTVHGDDGPERDEVAAEFKRQEIAKAIERADAQELEGLKGDLLDLRESLRETLAPEIAMMNQVLEELESGTMNALVSTSISAGMSMSSPGATSLGRYYSHMSAQMTPAMDQMRAQSIRYTRSLMGDEDELFSDP